jgi:competence ComEA-like helix-hairpin-helix protein
MVSRKDRLAALIVGILVLAYAVISMPPGVPATYFARVDSMEIKPVNSYISTNRKKYSHVEAGSDRSDRSDRQVRSPHNTHEQGSSRSRIYTDNGQRTEKALKTPRQVIYKPLALNGSDSAALEKLPGIGPVLASRIIRYREKLGGFYHRSQLREVYGIDDSLYAFIEHFIETNPAEGSLKKMDINTATLETLRQHPYLRWEKAKAIIRYREANGPFANVRDLEKILTLDTLTIRRLLPYVVVNATTPPTN